jgi:KDO2-lipid IV(A) lauroyltransferase
MQLSFFAPKYWLTWIGVGTLRAVASLPPAGQRRLGLMLGRLIRHSGLAFVRIARANIALCFPSLTDSGVETLLARHCESLGLGLCETANTWWCSDADVKRSAEILGLDHLHDALKAGRGAIMIGGHFTTIEIATRILGTAVALNVLYRPPKNRLLAHIMRGSFVKYGKPIAHDDIRSMIRALAKNEVVWYAPDQSYRNKGAAMVDFFGVPSATNTATSRLARITGAAVLTYFPERLPNSMRYQVVIGSALADFPGDDPILDVARFHTLLESQIRRVPEQYLWIHRRFKGLGDQHPNYYGRDARVRSGRPAPAYVPGTKSMSRYL